MIKLNDNPVNVTMFPDNTSQCWKLNEEFLNKPFTTSVVTWNFEHEGEFLHLAQLKDLLDHSAIYSVLVINYLPYARQDKELSNSQTFALWPFARLLNTLQFKTIYIQDPHSNVALHLIDNSQAFFPVNEVKDTICCTKSNIVCYPDKGARVKYADIYEYNHVYADKVRDQLTGKILSIALQGDVQSKNVLIVDDICDGGGTFIGLAEVLYAKGASTVNLFVTHGLFTKGTKALFDSGIKRIFTSSGEIKDIT